MNQRIVSVGSLLLLLAMIVLFRMQRGFDRAIARFISPLPTPTAMICATFQDWLVYSDPVVGISLRYPPEGTFSATPRYNLPLAERTGTVLGIGASIRPACKGYNSNCYEKMGISIGVYENLEALSLEAYLINRYARNSKVSERDLYRYGEAVTIAGNNGIRFDVAYASPEWVKKITGHPYVPNIPVTFIAHGSYVTQIYMSPPVREPVDSPLDPPCAQAIQLYDEILSTFRFE